MPFKIYRKDNDLSTIDTGNLSKEEIRKLDPEYYRWQDSEDETVVIKLLNDWFNKDVAKQDFQKLKVRITGTDTTDEDNLKSLPGAIENLKKVKTSSDFNKDGGLVFADNFKIMNNFINKSKLKQDEYKIIFNAADIPKIKKEKINTSDDMIKNNLEKIIYTHIRDIENKNRKFQPKINNNKKEEIVRFQVNVEDNKKLKIEIFLDINAFYKDNNIQEVQKEFSTLFLADNFNNKLNKYLEDRYKLKIIKTYDPTFVITKNYRWGCRIIYEYILQQIVDEELIDDNFNYDDYIEGVLFEDMDKDKIFEEKFEFIAPAYRGDKYPAFKEDAVNESEYSDNMRFRSYDITQEGNNVNIEYVTQEPFTRDDYETRGFQTELYRALVAFCKKHDLYDIIVTINIEDRDGESDPITDEFHITDEDFVDDEIDEYLYEDFNDEETGFVKVKIYNIDYDVRDEDITDYKISKEEILENLPKELTLVIYKDDIDEYEEEAVIDAISDYTGYLVNGCNYEVIDQNAEYEIPEYLNEDLQQIYTDDKIDVVKDTKNEKEHQVFDKRGKLLGKIQNKSDKEVISQYSGGIKESLNEIDIMTNNKYDLLNMYCSLEENLSDKDKQLIKESLSRGPGSKYSTFKLLESIYEKMIGYEE